MALGQVCITSPRMTPQPLPPAAPVTLKFVRTQGSVEFEAEQKDLADSIAAEEDEEHIVDQYKLIDKNMAEIGKAGREGRRIKYRPDDGKKKKKKKDFAGKQVGLKRLSNLCWGVP